MTEFAKALTGWSIRQPNLPPRLYTGAIDGPHGFAWVPAIHEPGTRRIMQSADQMESETGRESKLGKWAARLL